MSIVTSRCSTAVTGRHREVILAAAKEVGQPVVFGILIIIIVFLPVLSLHGMEGKMFKPLAYTIMIALLVSLALSLTLSPVLCSLMLKRGSEEDPWIVRWAKRLYAPSLRWALGNGKVVLQRGRRIAPVQPGARSILGE